jgi:carbon monoxide dehydrogenase subunit G
VEKVGVVPIRVELTAHIDAEDPPNSLHAVATAEHVDVEVDVRLHASGRGTELVGLVRLSGRGPLKPVVDRLFERRATERTAQFAQLLEARFGGAPKSVTPAPTADGRLTQIWRRLLRRLGLG